MNFFCKFFFAFVREIFFFEIAICFMSTSCISTYAEGSSEPTAIPIAEYVNLVLNLTNHIRDRQLINPTVKYSTCARSLRHRVDKFWKKLGDEEKGVYEALNTVLSDLISFVKDRKRILENAKDTLSWSETSLDKETFKYVFQSLKGISIKCCSDFITKDAMRKTKPPMNLTTALCTLYKATDEDKAFVTYESQLEFWRLLNSEEDVLRDLQYLSRQFSNADISKSVLKCNERKDVLRKTLDDVGNITLYKFVRDVAQIERIYSTQMTREYKECLFILHNAKDPEINTIHKILAMTWTEDTPMSRADRFCYQIQTLYQHTSYSHLRVLSFIEILPEDCKCKLGDSSYKKYISHISQYQPYSDIAIVGRILADVTPLPS